MSNTKFGLDRLFIYSRVHHGLQDDIYKMKAMKSDAVFDFSSDCLINASNKLKDHVTTLFKRFLSTGKIPAF